MSLPEAECRARLRFFHAVDASRPWIGRRTSLAPGDAEHFPGDTLAASFARELCLRAAVPAKELFEATEVFALARKVVRSPTVADLCCGHGLAGVLFAVMERSVDRVLLVDRQRPASADAVLAAAEAVAPWVAGKIEWREASLKRVTLEAGTGVIAIHACGLRTDAAMELAIEAGGGFAALPCCRPHRLHPAPESLKRALGADVAIDVHRTYALENAGYHVKWAEIAPAISAHHRVLLARARRPERPADAAGSRGH